MTDNFEHIRLEVRDHRSPGALWEPVAGPELLSLFGSSQGGALSDAEQRTLAREATAILSRCVAPGSSNATRTGIAVGYVQSGKTMSFTALSALAADNATPIVIVVTGTSVNLNDQSVTRLEQDLRLDTRTDRKWLTLHNPRTEQAATLRAALEAWADPNAEPYERRVTLITVMKQHVHLRNLVDLLSQVDVSRSTALIIDDEADQASMNTKVNLGQESTTYRQLNALRDSLPRHSFIQYTATPQAPLLINLIDQLSPEFVQVLTPGVNYVGGNDYFEPGNLVSTIPTPEIPTAQNILQTPPASLIEALQFFIMGAAASKIIKQNSGNRSMLVHPSQLRDSHAQYVTWVRAILARFEQTLAAPDSDPDKQALIGEFTAVYQALLQTQPGIPDLAKVLARLRQFIREIAVIEVNTRQGETPQIEWRNSFAWILVGGTALDRGYTVQGLTTTYMPRRPGVGNADTIQQRGRFFGYKRDYLGLCRLYLEAQTRAAFEDYVEHEEDIRNRLRIHAATGRPLVELRREFFLSVNLRPTRPNIIDVSYSQDLAGGRDWTISKSPHLIPTLIGPNRELIRNYVANTGPWMKDQGSDNRSEIQTHLVTGRLRLAEVYRDLLADLRFAEAASPTELAMLMVVLAALAERSPDTPCVVFRMSGGKSRDRGIDDDGAILNLFQGAHPDTSGAIYPGDRKIRVQDAITVQLHTLNITAASGSVQDVPAIAISVPPEFARGVLIQNQGG